MQNGPLFSYRKRVELGEFKPDPAQENLAENLQTLHNALIDYKPNTEKIGWGEKLGLRRRHFQPLDGLYIYGGVGGGKSMLMDLFFDAVPITVPGVTTLVIYFHTHFFGGHPRVTGIGYYWACAHTF